MSEVVLIYPFEFELLWRLSQHRLTAGELADDLNQPVHAWPERTPIGVSNQLRGLERRGYIEHDGGRPRIYRLTGRGQEYVNA